MEIETEKVILRISLDGQLLGQFNNVKHATRIIGGSTQCIYKAVWEKKLYKESFWRYGFIKKEIETTTGIIAHKEETGQEISCLKCSCIFLTHNKKINHICPGCNIVNENIWDNTTVYKAHCSV